jgi:hypothetical protein
MCPQSYACAPARKDRIGIEVPNLIESSRRRSAANVVSYLSPVVVAEAVGNPEGKTVSHLDTYHLNRALDPSVGEG